MDIYQDKYDEETESSMNGKQQRIWNIRIAEQVAALDNYSSTQLKIGFKKKWVLSVHHLKI